MIGSPLVRAPRRRLAAARTGGWRSRRCSRADTDKVGTAGTLERILLGPAHVTDGSENLVGALRQSMAALGARTLREMQRVEMVYAPRRPRPRASPATGPLTTDDIGDDLFFEGKVARIKDARAPERLPRVVAAGMDEADGSVLVAAGDRADWALNLFEDPTVDAEVGERRFRRSPTTRRRRLARAIRGLILRYGTPAERLGRGPSFRLRPPGRPARPMAIEVAVESTVEAALDAVFATIADLEAWPTWSPSRAGSGPSTPGSDGPPTAGERLVVEQDAAGRAGRFEATITALEQGRRLALRGRDADGVTIDIEALVETGGGPRCFGDRAALDDPIGLLLRYRVRVAGLPAGRAGGPFRHRRPAHHLGAAGRGLTSVHGVSRQASMPRAGSARHRAVATRTRRKDLDRMTAAPTTRSASTAGPGGFAAFLTSLNGFAVLARRCSSFPTPPIDAPRGDPRSSSARWSGSPTSWRWSD